MWIPVVARKRRAEALQYAGGQGGTSALLRQNRISFPPEGNQTGDPKPGQTCGAMADIGTLRVFKGETMPNVSTGRPICSVRLRHRRFC